MTAAESVMLQAPPEGVAFTVTGIPAPQGSKRHVGNGIMIESSKKVKPWREDVRAEALDAMNGTPSYAGAVEVKITFLLLRPKSAPKARVLPTVRPDLDKLARSTLDALKSAGVYADDSQVTDLIVCKRYGVTAGAEILVRLV